MSGGARGKATSELADAVSLWRVSHASTPAVIDAAVACLLADVDSPTLRELAGTSPSGSWFDLAPMIEQTMEELGLSDVLTGRPDAGAMAAMARRFERGELGARELCAWAHRTIGHEGDADCQVFVELDDTFDLDGCGAEDEASLQHRTAEAVQTFLAARR